MSDHPNTHFHGPFTEHRVSVDGYHVPRVSIQKLTAEEDGSVNVILDRRFCVFADELEAKKWLPLIAHALAIGAGYSCHGANSVEMNPYKVKMLEITST